MEAELLTAYLQGNMEKTSEIVDLVDLRRIPVYQGKNENMTLGELKNHPNHLWPVPLLMLYAKNVPETTMV